MYIHICIWIFSKQIHKNIFIDVLYHYINYTHVLYSKIYTTFAATSHF